MEYNVDTLLENQYYQSNKFKHVLLFEIAMEST